MDRIAQVILVAPIFSHYDYKFDADLNLHIGQVVTVPLGSRKITGVIASFNQETDYPINKIKKIISVFDAPPLPASLLAFVKKTSSYNLVSEGDILKTVLRGLTLKINTPSEKFYHLTHKKPLERLTEKRKACLSYLEEKDFTPFAELREHFSTSIIKALMDNGFIEIITCKKTHSYEKADLSFITPEFGKDQAIAVERFKEIFDAPSFKTFLLDGVTGSGKTETFLEATAANFKNGKQCLILMPEISLTDQAAKRYEKRFGVKPAIWHSNITDQERYLITCGVRDGSIDCVIGARSGLFLPFGNLGCIIIDEEHDGSYKQEEGFRYNARDMAVLRAKTENIPIILASATPSLESYVNAEIGRYEKLLLRERFGGAVMPKIKLINMVMNPPDKGSWISHPLRTAINETYARGEQSLLFINRRGYAPLMICRGCGYRIECPYCSAWMVYHQSSYKLKCHQCGQSSEPPSQCGSCGAVDKFVPCGPGVERLYEEATALFPHLKCEILSSDHQNNPERLSQLLHEIHEGHIHLLIGTQMVAKGHDFPKLTTVGVIDADLGLKGGDLRAGEKSFQILEQVSGRAGRSAGTQGTVYIQTYNPEHPVMKALEAHDRDCFLDNEAQTRLELEHPPFGRMAALILSSEHQKNLHDFAHHLASLQPHADNIQIFGPAPAAIAMLRGRYRYRFLIKSQKNINIQNFIQYWLQRVKIPNSIRLNIDIDPISFL